MAEHNREAWLNGWPRNGDTVLIGSGVHCAGCGRLFGLATVALRGNEVLPDRDPGWPFNESDCPVHSQWKHPDPTINPNRLDPNRLR